MLPGPGTSMVTSAPGVPFQTRSTRNVARCRPLSEEGSARSITPSNTQVAAARAVATGCSMHEQAEAGALHASTTVRAKAEVSFTVAR